MTVPPARWRSPHVRCRWCGGILPSWLPIPDVPNTALLLHHLGVHHLAAAQPYLRRMEVECLGTVVMELFEREQAAELTAELLGRLSPEALRAAIDAALAPDHAR